MALHVDVLSRRSRTTVLRRYVQGHWGWYQYSQWLWLTSVLVGTTLAGVLILTWPHQVPISGFMICGVVGGVKLRMRLLYLTYGYIGVWLLFTLIALDGNKEAMPSSAMATVIVLAIMLGVAHSRERLGLQGVSGASLLLDLRDRLRTNGTLPSLPAGWSGEAVLASAHGEGFSGDFIVTNVDRDQRQLEVAVVDVSGKGSEAGSRALQLQGAFSGMLGSLPPEQFLPAANDYLLRQRWEEGFATVVQVCLDFQTGVVQVFSAGHPPAVHLDAGAGRWETISGPNGPLLGVMAEVDFPQQEFILNRGDALLLYTDGVIEGRHTQLVDGIDRLAGIAEAHLSRGLEGLAQRLCSTARGGEGDDRAVVVLWRA